MSMVNEARLLRVAPWRHGDVIAASAVLNLLSLAMPLAILQVYDRIVPNKSFATLAILVAGVAVALSLEALLTLARSRLIGWSAARVEHAAGSAAVERLLSANIVEFERIGAGIHMERLAALSQLKDFFGGQAALVLADLPFAALFLLAIWWLAGPLVYVALGLVAVLAVLAMIEGRSLRKALATAATEDERRLNFILEVLTGIHTVKGLGMEALMLRRYERLLESCAQAGYKVQVLSAEANNLGFSMSQVTMVALAAAGSLLVIDNSLTVGALAACSMLGSRAIQPVQRALGLWTRFQTFRVAQQRAEQLFAMQPDPPERFRGLANPEGRLVLRDVGFRYSPDLPPVLQGVNLDVAPGEAIGITGEAGAGKSTLLWLIMGLLDPTEGKVVIDGRTPRGLPAEDLRGLVAHVAQEAQLFEGTILENIAGFRDGEYLERAKRAAALTELDGVVGRLPKGFDTRVGEGAIEALPRGVVQRIAFARAMVDEPKIILFDAANASLDAQGDAIVRKLVEQLKGKTTLVLVSLRPSLLRLADRVYELSDGRLKAVPQRPRQVA